MAAACVVVVATGEIANLIGLDIRTQVAPVITAAGVVAAVGLFYLQEASDRRRKTLEAFEKQLYDPDLRSAISTVVTALHTGSFEGDAEPDRVGSHRDLTSFIINYIEVCCEGAERGLYDRAMVRELLAPLATLLIENFLVAPNGRELPSRRFLSSAARLSNMQATFADAFRTARRRP